VGTNFKYNICILYMDDTISKVPTISSTPGLPSTPAVGANGATASPAGWSWGTIFKVFLILVVLAILGLNVFTYLAKGSDLFSEILGRFTHKLPAVLQDTVELSEKGTELGIEVAGGTVQSAGDVLTRELGLRHSQMWENRDRTLKNAVEQRRMPHINEHPEYEPDRSDSNVQAKRKPGWCYIGTDRGFRSCIRVGDSDKCMSGRIFPTRDICINPSLRQ